MWKLKKSIWIPVIFFIIIPINVLAIISDFGNSGGYSSGSVSGPHFAHITFNGTNTPSNMTIFFETGSDFGSLKIALWKNGSDVAIGNETPVDNDHVDFVLDEADQIPGGVYWISWMSPPDSFTEVFKTGQILPLTDNGLQLGCFGFQNNPFAQNPTNYNDGSCTITTWRGIIKVEWTDVASKIIIEGTSINNTVPRVNDIVNISINVSVTEANITGYSFAWDDTGSFVNDTFVDISDQRISVANISINKTITAAEGTFISYRWTINDTDGKTVMSKLFNFTVAGFTAPNETIHGNNFFNGNNKSIISLAESTIAFLNLSFEDNIELFGMELRIRDANDILIFNFSNSSLSGTIDNITRTINVSSHQGFFTVNVTVTDTHTARFIPDYKIDKGMQNYLIFNDKIKITAEGAIFSNSKKNLDRYSLEFTYIPFFAPENKVFYIESDRRLSYRKDSQFKAHFVDEKNNNWIDFEGVEGKPIITKITDFKWKIEFSNTESKLIFNSIGSLNQNSNFYQYYLANASVEFVIPTSILTSSINNSIQLSLNVTGSARNKTIFKLHNSSKNLIDTFNVSNNGTGTYFYNHTFTGLVGDIHYINATNVDITGQHINSTTTIKFQKIQLTDCTIGARVINFTIEDEGNASLLDGDASLVFTFNGTNPTETFTRTITSENNFSVCIFPPEEKLIADYTATYSAPLYQQRVIIVTDSILTNVTQTKALKLLRDVDGIFATFRLIDSFQNPLSEVLSQVEITSGDVVESRNTDDAGIVTFFVDPDITYIFTFSKSGFKTSTSSLRVTSTDIITITLEAEAAAVQASIYTGIDYFFKPSANVLNNNTDFEFIFNMTSTFWNLTGCTLKLRNNSEVLTSSSSTFNGSQCIIPITFNTGNQTVIISEATYELNNTFNNTVSIQYTVLFTFQGNFSLKTFIDDINAFTSAGFNDFTRFIITIIIILGIVGWASSELSALRGEPEILIGLTVALVFLFSYIGWLNIPLETFPNIRGLPENWLKQWIIFILSFMGGGSYIMNKKF